MGTGDTAGLAEVQPPRAYRRHRFSEARLLTIARQLHSGRWLAEAPNPSTYGQARYRAERLIRDLLDSGFAGGELEYRTWQIEGGYQWAIHERKE